MIPARQPGLFVTRWRSRTVTRADDRIRRAQVQRGEAERSVADGQPRVAHAALAQLPQLPQLPQQVEPRLRVLGLAVPHGPGFLAAVGNCARLGRPLGRI